MLGRLFMSASNWDQACAMDIEGKLNEPRSANMAVGDATNGNVDEVGTATLALNGKPNQIGGAAVRRLCLPVQS